MQHVSAQSFEDRLAELVQAVDPDDVPEALGSLEMAKARLWARLTSGRGAGGEPDRLLTVAEGDDTTTNRLLGVEEVARILGTTPRWVYRHLSRKPFARHLSRRCLKFDERGLRAWVARHPDP